MTSFDELGVAPELVEALVAEGIEVPTAFQEAAIPVLLRGNPLLAQAGPGAGTLIAYGLPLLQAVDPEAGGPRALVLAPTLQAASDLAISMARMAIVTGHQVAALGSHWALANRASILFSAPEDLLRAVRASQIGLDGVQVVVVDGFSALPSGGKEALETLFESVPKEAQRVVLAQPFTAEAEEFGKAHLHRAVHLPPKAAQTGAGTTPPQRGSVFYRLTGESRYPEILRTVAGILEEGVHHALLFLNSEDEAADVGDFLALHGFLAGAPGEAEYPVWLSVAELEGRKMLDEWPGPGTVVTLSVDVPADPDSLDRRHGGQTEGVVLVRARELPHLKDVARRTGYRLAPAREPVPKRVAGELERLTDTLARTIREENLAPHYLALEPLLAEFSPAEVAAAALALLQARPPSTRPSAPAAASALETPSGGPPPKAWVRLFVGVGEKDGVGPGDLLGAIAGEAGVEGSQVGKIEIRETFSLVEVTPASADRIIRSLNGTTIRSRSVRVDYDRGGPRGRGATGSHGRREGGPTRREGPPRRPRRDRPDS